MNTRLEFSDIYDFYFILMSHSRFDLFHTGLYLGGGGGGTTPFFSPVFISRNKCTFPSPIHILHAHENAPHKHPPNFDILMTFLIRELVKESL